MCLLGIVLRILYGNIHYPFSFLLSSFQVWSDFDDTDDEIKEKKGGKEKEEEGVGCLEYLLQNGANVDLSSVYIFHLLFLFCIEYFYDILRFFIDAFF